MSLGSKLKAVLVDLSGTIHIDDFVIPGALEALERLRKSHLKIKFVTNTTKESKNTLHQRLTRIGFKICQEEIFTSLTAARNYVEKQNARPMLLLSEDALRDFSGISTDNPNAVVVGLAPESFNFGTLNKAFSNTQSQVLQRPDGLALGPGPFVQGLEYATGVTATVVGKPERAFFTEALDSLGCLPEDAVIIGDDVTGDIEGAQKIGVKGILVKTGKYRDGDERKIDPLPSCVAENFASAVDLILKEGT
ncbi:putative haloacid dehalogenase-like hydrolase domain-containing protein 2 [Apostichopus japonicus]|uniref:Haloacid dehalogenase-like hydrolase domain-containing protein 2 n=1 Tax=Stichopus japonicus TaxID=307972 RepID=A0A2G8L5X5_STIJA|nr:putative haloacid dehalogenase-like hydrolase domain-containing protein 2 [Apostichopus japonicus]